MSLGRTPAEADFFRNASRYCAERLSPTSVFSLLHRDGRRLFPDEDFADLFQKMGRDCVPPRIVATVMVLQRLEGLSDREAVDRFAFDLRWKYAAGGLDFDHSGFVHTVLVDMRARLRQSQRPNRVFERVLEVAREAGLVGRRRVLDSTPLYDAVTTQDTVTMIRQAIRQLLRKAAPGLATELRAVLKRDDDYASAGKPKCDWDDKQAREDLIDELAREAYALLAELDGRKLSPEEGEAASLLATVVGQDLEKTEDGRFRIARKVAPDRVISVVDPETRHGHKTAAKGFDGYKGHLSVDPDSELVTAAQVSAGNVGDGAVAPKLIEEALLEPQAAAELKAEPKAGSDELSANATKTPTNKSSNAAGLEVYGDASYGTAENIELVEQAGGESFLKVQAATNRKGLFTKSDFQIDLEQQSVTCPKGELIPIKRHSDGSGTADFGSRCAGCPLAPQCTSSKSGRTISIHAHEQTLERQREKQRTADWKAAYRATRPKVERKIGHLMFRRHGGRRVRVRGLERVAQDFLMLAAAANLRRLAVLGVRFARQFQGWTTAEA